MEVKDLNLYYGDFQALKHVSISMPEKGNYGLYWAFWLRKIHPSEDPEPDE